MTKVICIDFHHNFVDISVSLLLVGVVGPVGVTVVVDVEFTAIAVIVGTIAGIVVGIVPVGVVPVGVVPVGVVPVGVPFVGVFVAGVGLDEFPDVTDTAGSLVTCVDDAFDLTRDLNEIDLNEKNLERNDMVLLV